MSRRFGPLAALLSVLLLGACPPASPAASELGSLALDDADASTGAPSSEPAKPPAEPPSEPVPIVGGQPVPTCGWPSTVALWSATTLCTGTLLHPSLVVYAAHCGDDFTEVRLGERVQGSGLRRVVPVEHCRVLPGGGPGGGDDFAYCVLAQPVDDVPIVPPLLGCELEAIELGEPVTLVGFGRDELGHDGRKREVDTALVAITAAGEVQLGGEGLDTCQGDSGGPAFVQAADGSWRTFAVTSWGGRCGDGGYSSVLAAGLPWLESQTGLDLTPCHDADGTWNPGPDCDALPLQPWVGDGTWSQGCAGGPVTGPSDACGAPWAPPTEAACEGSCGTQAPAGCWCDAACSTHDDCCPDVTSTCAAGSCAGFCDAQAPAGCWCDAECEDYGDCCSDVADACG